VWNREGRSARVTTLANGDHHRRLHARDSLECVGDGKCHQRQVAIKTKFPGGLVENLLEICFQTERGSICKSLKRWWTWSGSVLHGVLIIRKLLILRMPKRSKMPSLPDRLQDFCTVNFSKNQSSFLPTGLRVSSFQNTNSNSPQY